MCTHNNLAAQCATFVSCTPIASAPMILFRRVCIATRSVRDANYCTHVHICKLRNRRCCVRLHCTAAACGILTFTRAQHNLLCSVLSHCHYDYDVQCVTKTVTRQIEKREYAQQFKTRVTTRAEHLHCLTEQFVLGWGERCQNTRPSRPMIL